MPEWAQTSPPQPLRCSRPNPVPVHNRFSTALPCSRVTGHEGEHVHVFPDDGSAWLWNDDEPDVRTARAGAYAEWGEPNIHRLHDDLGLALAASECSDCGERGHSWPDCPTGSDEEDDGEPDYDEAYEENSCSCVDCVAASMYVAEVS